MSTLATLVMEWERMSARYLRGRGRLLEGLVGTLVERGVRDVVDLGCGPATLIGELAAEGVSGRLTGIDSDPVLLALARAHLADRGVNATLLDTSLEPGWAETHGLVGGFDAVTAVLVMHYFPAGAWPDVLTDIRRVLRPGGVFVMVDVVDGNDDEIADDDMASGLSDWLQWWSAAEQHAGLRDAFRARRAVPGPASAEYHPDVPTILNHLMEAGFVDIAVLDQVGRSMTIIGMTPT